MTCPVDQRSHGNLDHQIIGGFAVHFFPFSVFSVAGRHMVGVPQMLQGIQIFIYLKNHVAAFSAVPAYGAACRYVFFPMEGNATVAAVSCFQIKLRAVNKHNQSPFDCILF